MSPFVNGTRYLWFAKGIGLVKMRYEHANGLTTEAELVEYRIPGKVEEFHPLQIGSTYTYKYHSVFLHETVIEKWRVTETFEPDRFLFRGSRRRRENYLYPL